MGIAKHVGLLVRLLHRAIPAQRLFSVEVILLLLLLKQLLVKLYNIATMILLRWTPHPVIVTIRDNKDYIRVLLYS